MTKDELLTALLVERQDQTWWRHRPVTARPTPKVPRSVATGPLSAEEMARLMHDDEVTCAKRRRDLLNSWTEREREAG